MTRKSFMMMEIMSYKREIMRKFAVQNFDCDVKWMILLQF